MFENLEIARLKYILTMDCNFRCDYCFEGGKSGLALDVDEAVRVGRQVLDEMSQELLTVLYFGGEPFLRYRDMMLITGSLKAYALRIGKRIAFSVITNGSILPPELIEHLKRYHYYTSVSCDGLGHDLHRGYKGGAKESFDRVMAAVRTLNKATPDFCVSMVVTRQNCEFLADSISMFLANGIRNFAISPVLDLADFTPDRDEYFRQLHSVIGDLARLPVVVNPPLDREWDEDNRTRRMCLSDNAVNIEVSPLGTRIVKERDTSLSLDFGTLADARRQPASPKTRQGIIAAERELARIYRRAREINEKCQ